MKPLKDLYVNTKEYTSTEVYFEQYKIIIKLTSQVYFTTILQI